MSEYKSVKEDLPEDNLFHDVIVILHDETIGGGYHYALGLFQKCCFHVGHNMYSKNQNYRSGEYKVIAWKFLEKCTADEITMFIEKAKK